jgi:hypothetical protein
MLGDENNGRKKLEKSLVKKFAQIAGAFRKGACPILDFKEVTAVLATLPTFPPQRLVSPRQQRIPWDITLNAMT